MILGVRPEDLRDDPEFLAAHPDLAVEAVVEVSEPMGSEVYLYLDYREQKLIARVKPDTASRNGQRVRLGVDTRKAYLFDPATEQAILTR
ncbi:MAG: TOBE domain-containing protein [Peptococcaceae bacterium]|nr:TOBE domain-containing protein [Peptococcaceae bacterium]